MPRRKVIRPSSGNEETLETLGEYFSDLVIPEERSYYYDDIDSARVKKRAAYFRFLESKARLNRSQKNDPIIASNQEYLKSKYPSWFPWHSHIVKGTTVRKDMTLRIKKLPEFERRYLESYSSSPKVSDFKYGIGDISQQTGISQGQIKAIIRSGIFNGDKVTFDKFEYYLIVDSIIYAYEHKEVLRVTNKSKLLDYMKVFYKAKYAKYKETYGGF
jgi:hypothetical protein